MQPSASGGKADLTKYELTINIPECGTASMSMLKMCGSLGSAREGLMVDMSIGGFNRTIVKNGILLNNEFWDRDLDNDVFTIPESENHTSFYFYM